MLDNTAPTPAIVKIVSQVSNLVFEYLIVIFSMRNNSLELFGEEKRHYNHFLCVYICFVRLQAEVKVL